MSSLADDAPHAKVLRLLRVLHQLNSLEAEGTVFSGEKRNLPETAFVNNKLSAKLTRQLEETMIVARSALVTEIRNTTNSWHLALAYLTGLLISLNTSHSFSLSLRDTTSFNLPPLAMPDLSSSGNHSSHAADRTTRDVMMVSGSSDGCSDKRYASRGNTYWKAQ